MVHAFKKHYGFWGILIGIAVWITLGVVWPVQGEDAHTAWLMQESVAFRTEKFDQGFEDLVPLKEMVGDARIVALGEGTHGTAEFFRMKHRITEYLATELGFTIFAIEANMPEAQKINDYILTGKGDVKEALAGLHFWTWNTQEVLDMILWMRSFNASGKGQIVFWGFDMQFPHAALDNVQAFIEKVEPASNIWIATCEEIRGAYSRAKTSQVARHTWQQAAQKLLLHMESKRSVYERQFEPQYLAWIIQNARLVWQSAVVEAEFARARTTPGTDSSSRDGFMAQNVEWILSQHPPGSKMVLWAHNGHVSRTGFPLLESPMGYRLARKFGQEFINVGFAFYEGTYTAKTRKGDVGTFSLNPAEQGSVGWWFHQVDEDKLILDLRKASRQEKQSAWLYEELDFRQVGALVGDRSLLVVLPEAFDVLIFFDQTHASTLLDTPIMNPWKKQVSDSKK